MQVRTIQVGRFVSALALGAFLFTFASGCGGGKGNVSGEVTVDGKPLVLGVIVFTPADGPAVAAEVVDGKYTAIGVAAGENKVSLDLTNLKQLAQAAAPKTGVAAMASKFSKDDISKQKSMNPGAFAKDLGSDVKDALAAQQQASAEANRRSKAALPQLKEIPEKYTDPKSSGWTLSVSTGSNTFNANVTK